jgi:serine beta-lactamase-like protein LACTB, mitochondrial
MRSLRHLIFLAICSAAQIATASDAVTQAIETYIREKGVTGASVAIGVKDRIVYERGFGWADLEHDVRASSVTVYRLASISKSITATAVMQLVEAGKVKLDEDARKYVPEFPEKTHPFTVRHLLCHQSGIRHYKPEELESVKRYTSVLDGFERFANDPLVHEPGAKYTYSTYSYSILARLVENVSGKSFRDYLKESVFKPAGMQETDTEDLQPIVKNRSRGYRRGPEGPINSPFGDMSYKHGGGGIISTAGDLCRFGLALVDGRILGSEARAQMWTEQRTADGKATAYGLGWMIEDNVAGKIVRHGGSQFGARTYLYIAPAQGLVVAVLTNYESHNPRELLNLIVDAWASKDRQMRESPRLSPGALDVRVSFRVSP